VVKKYCQNCNNELLPSIKICPKCGSKDIGPSEKQEFISKDEFKASESTENKTTPSSSSENSYTENNTSSFVTNFLLIGGGTLATIFFFGFGIIQVVAGYIGIEHEFGSGWAIAAITLFIILRFSLPLMFGMFFCALNVWGWHWFWALLFTAPGLIFLIPGMIAAMIDSNRR
jgi:hypothetical protein